MFWRETGNFAKRFIVIYGFTMLATWIVCVLFNQDAQFQLDYFGDMILFSLCADVISLTRIFVRELSKKEWWISVGIQFVLMEAVLMPLGHYFYMWEGSVGAVIFFVTILLVDIGVHLIEYGQDVATAKDLNQRLSERRKEKAQ